MKPSINQGAHLWSRSRWAARLKAKTPEKQSATNARGCLPSNHALWSDLRDERESEIRTLRAGWNVLRMRSVSASTICSPQIECGSLLHPVRGGGPRKRSATRGAPPPTNERTTSHLYRQRKAMCDEKESSNEPPFASPPRLHICVSPPLLILSITTSFIGRGSSNAYETGRVLAYVPVRRVGGFPTTR